MLNARLIHREVCSLLSEAFDNLHSTIAQYNRIIPVWQQVETPIGLKTAVTIPQTNKVFDYNNNNTILVQSYIIKQKNKIIKNSFFIRS